MNIAIIGAGISGLLSALELVEHGCSVSIFDQQQFGQAASWAGGGILSPMYPWRYPAAVNQLAQHGKIGYHTWNEKLKPITGIDFQIHETGMLILDEADFDVGLNYAKHHQEPMQTSQLLPQHDLQQLNPKISSQFQQALYFPQLANIRNPRVLQSISAYLAQHPNVTLYPNCPIQHIQHTHGKIQYIETAQGQRHIAEHYVIATGAWSAAWSTCLKRQISVHPVHGQMLLFKTPKNWLPTMCMNQVMYLIPRQDGHIVCGSSMSDFGFDTTPRAEIQHNIQTACFEMIPELTQFPVVKQWAGLRPSSPTGVPYIGQFAEFTNLWANFGHYRNGLCMGPASAQLLRQLMLKQNPIVDPTAYSVERLKPITSQQNFA